MNRRHFLLTTLAASVASVSAGAAEPLPAVEVFKSPSCSCCAAWVEHLQGAGFPVTVRTTNDLAAVRKRVGLADQYASCHTGVVAGYVLEGHVPAEDVKRLLTSRPDALGLAVPGMPASAPGMDMKPVQPYEVLLVDKQGGAKLYARYPKA